jgi:hypothetical protein
MRAEMKVRTDTMPPFGRCSEVCILTAVQNNSSLYPPPRIEYQEYFLGVKAAGA